MADQTTFGELQTLIATLQNTNVQLGQIVKAMVGSSTALGAALGRSTASAPAAVGGPPGTPDGTFAFTLPDGSTAYVPYYTTRP